MLSMGNYKLKSLVKGLNEIKLNMLVKVLYTKTIKSPFDESRPFFTLTKKITI